MNNLLLEKIMEHIKIFELMKKDDVMLNQIVYAANMVAESLRNGGALYLCGNGGSAADAQHIATEFVSRFYTERKALNAEALTVNTSSITAIGNDYDFDRVFVRQLEAKGKQGDILMGISTSGVSKNVVNAMRYAVENHIHSILLTGNKGILVNSKEYDVVIKVPSDDTPRIQEAHIFVGHVMAEYVEKAMMEEPR